MKSFKNIFFLILTILLIIYHSAEAQSLLTNTASRLTYSLNGPWQYIIDPYETGFYNYRFLEMHENDPGAYWNSDVPENRSARIEYGYNEKNILNVPGDWNYQKPEFLYYEGTVWYKKSFDYQKKNELSRLFLYFGAVNYQAEIYLNGKKLGSHKGGFTPFQFELDESILKEEDNFLVVKVDNSRHKDEVPTVKEESIFCSEEVL